VCNQWIYVVGLVSLVVPMVNLHEEETNSLVRRSSTRRLFSTPVIPDDDIDFVIQNVVTPVTQAAMDPLMQPALQTPPLSITPIGVDTPPVEKYTHVSMIT
jgi:hypothetical protein